MRLSTITFMSLFMIGCLAKAEPSVRCEIVAGVRGETKIYDVNVPNIAKTPQHFEGTALIDVGHSMKVKIEVIFDRKSHFYSERVLLKKISSREIDVVKGMKRKVIPNANDFFYQEKGYKRVLRSDFQVDNLDAVTISEQYTREQIQLEIDLPQLWIKAGIYVPAATGLCELFDEPL